MGDELFDWAERVWIAPCIESLPQPMHGFCMYGPMMLMAPIVVGLIALLYFCEQRQKAKALPAGAKKKKA